MRIVPIPAVAGLIALLLATLTVGQQPPPDPPDEAPVVDRVAQEPGTVPPEDDAPAPSPAPSVGPMEWLRAPGYDTLVCPFRGRLDYERGQVECGLIQVPENREVADSRTIELHFVRIPARGEDADGEPVEVRDDPVIYLTGGPGVKVEMYVDRLKDHPLMAQRDLYILEQRGIGHSGDFCPFFFDRNRADAIRDTFAGSQRALFEQALTCAENATAAGVDLRGYHTFENARDVRALRLALGLDDWNVWGISYGSVLGQAYLKVDPNGIRAAVLDAIVPLNIGELMRLPYWHSLNLDKLFGACAEQNDCRRAYPELAERYRAAIGAMTERALKVNVPESEIHPTGEAWFFQDLIVGLPFQLLYDESTHAAIPAIIDGLTRVVEARDTRFFRALALADDEGIPLSMGMSMAVRCMDGYITRWAESSPDDFRDYPLLARAFGDRDVIREAPEWCRRAGLAPRPAELFALVETDVPVVVANGAWDPVTPVPLAESILPGLASGRLAVFPHAGHGPTRSLDCAGPLMNRFFDDPDAPLDQECIDSGGEAADYIAPYFRTSVAVRAIVRQADNEDSLRLQAVVAGAILAIVLIGAVGLLSAWLTRRLSRSRVPAAGGARLLVFLAASATLAWLGGLTTAAWASQQITEALLLFGLVPWAMWFAWLAPLGLLLGLGGLIQTWRYKASFGMAARVGLSVVSAGSMGLTVYGIYWDLWPI